MKKKKSLRAYTSMCVQVIMACCIKMAKKMYILEALNGIRWKAQKQQEVKFATGKYGRYLLRNKYKNIPFLCMHTDICTRICWYS